MTSLFAVAGAFYICEWTPDEGKTEECHTLILSKVWGRKHEDPLKRKQKWYCKICGTKYKTYYGMLVEIREVGHQRRLPRLGQLHR